MAEGYTGGSGAMASETAGCTAPETRQAPGWGA